MFTFDGIPLECHYAHASTPHRRRRSRLQSFFLKRCEQPKYARCPYRARPSRGPCPARTTRSPPAREMLTPEQLSACASVPCTARPSPTRVNGSGKDTTLQCYNDLKSGTGCSPSPPPVVPSKLHAVIATHETERASARCTGGDATCLQYQSSRRLHSCAGRDVGGWKCP